MSIQSVEAFQEIATLHFLFQSVYLRPKIYWLPPRIHFHLLKHKVHNTFCKYGTPSCIRKFCFSIKMFFYFYFFKGLNIVVWSLQKHLSCSSAYACILVLTGSFRANVDCSTFVRSREHTTLYSSSFLIDIILSSGYLHLSNFSSLTWGQECYQSHCVGLFVLTS